jgi:glucuronosyltransferase
VFITHGGLLGFQEAIYHAVPLLMLPFGNDQKANAAKARREGIGLKLDWHDIDEQKIIDVLSKLTKDLR